MPPTISLISHHSFCVPFATCSIVGTGFDPIGTWTSLVTVVPSSKIDTASSRVEPLRWGSHTVQIYQYTMPNKIL